MKRNKLKILKTPNNAVVMSLMAVILLFGAPAVVSMIDDSYTTDVDVLSMIDDEDVTANYSIDGKYAEPGSLSVLKPSENDGSYLFVVNVADDVPLVTKILMVNFEISDFENFGRIEMTTNSDLRSMQITMRGDNVSTHYINGVYDEETQVWMFDLDSVDRAKIGSDEYTNLVLSLNYEEGMALSAIELTIVPYGVMTIPYGEIIIGATGVLLMVCALLATPWYGFSGYTGRRITRRR